MATPMRFPTKTVSIVLLAAIACLAMINTYGASPDPVLLQYIQADKLQAAGLDDTVCSAVLQSVGT